MNKSQETKMEEQAKEIATLKEQLKGSEKEVEAGKEVLGCVRRVLIRTEDEVTKLREVLERVERLIRADATWRGAFTMCQINTTAKQALSGNQRGKK